jgi:acyl-coenzyme A thioesterase PaaI-like protein
MDSEAHFRKLERGELIAEGRMVHEGGRLFVAESALRDQEGRLLAKGSGTFTRSKIALGAGLGYQEGPAGELRP